MRENTVKAKWRAGEVTLGGPGYEGDDRPLGRAGGGRLASQGGTR